MPAFNAAKYLHEAIDSILAQTRPDFELLVLDDGSTDATPAIARRHAERDARVRLVRRPNRGMANSLNELLGMARGRYVARMDADDVALPRRFEMQVRFLEDEPAVVCVGGAFELIDEKGRYLTTLKCPTSDDEIQRMILAGRGAIAHPAAMMRTEALRRIGGYDACYDPADDIDLWLRLGEAGALANLEEPVLRYRLHSASVSERQADKQLRAARLACEAAWRRRGIPGRFEGGAPWRPGPDRASRHEFMLRYGWWAYLSGERRTAAIYGVKALRALPLAPGGWKLVACALLKPARLQGA
jgi:glycosyltransferase involved in cell wall biosynthesis